MPKTKSLYEQIIEVYPELTSNDFQSGVITLQNDSDGAGDYIAEWNYSQPLPDGMKVGKA
jgi:hypothetical protein